MSLCKFTLRVSPWRVSWFGANSSQKVCLRKFLMQVSRRKLSECVFACLAYPRKFLWVSSSAWFPVQGKRLAKASPRKLSLYLSLCNLLCASFLPKSFSMQGVVLNASVQFLCISTMRISAEGRSPKSQNNSSPLLLRIDYTDARNRLCGCAEKQQKLKFWHNDHTDPVESAIFAEGFG